MRCYLFDIDGTLADCSHRLHYIEKAPKDWDGFFSNCHADKSIEAICDLAHTLWQCNNIVLVSGRPERCKVDTEIWLRQNHLNWNALYMRKDGDFRNDDIVKSELLDELLSHGWKPIMAFDDRKRVVDMWRARGIICAQVAEGDF